MKNALSANRAMMPLEWVMLLTLSFVWRQTQISSGQALILNATTPIFTVIVAHLFARDERMTMRHVLGTGLALPVLWP